jgi:hypothetical protein
MLQPGRVAQVLSLLQAGRLQQTVALQKTQAVKIWLLGVEERVQQTAEAGQLT